MRFMDRWQKIGDSYMIDGGRENKQTINHGGSEKEVVEGLLNFLFYFIHCS